MSSLAVPVTPSTNAVNALPVPTDMSVRRDDDAKPVSTVAIALQQDMMSSIIRHYISTSSIFSGLYTESKSEIIDDDINRFTKSIIISTPKKSGGRARLTDEQKAERDAKKLAAREAKQAERDRKRAEREAKKQLAREAKQKAAAEKKAREGEYTTVRLKYPKDHEQYDGKNGPKNTRGKFTRFMKHKTTGEVVKCQPEFWTEEANALFEEIFSNKPTPLMKPISEEKTQNNTTDELKKQRAIKIAELKAKEAEKKRAAEEAERQRAAEEAEKQKLADAQAKLLSESSQEGNNQQTQQEIEDFEQSDDEHSSQESSNKAKSFTHEYWPNQKLTIEDDAIMLAGEMVGYVDDDGTIIKV